MVALSACALACLLSASNDTVLLEFTADWCGACRAAEPTVRRLTAERFPVQQINVDRQQDVAARYHVSSVPCFVLVVNGQEVERVQGAASYARLVQMFQGGKMVAANDAAPNEPRQPSLVRGQSEGKSSGFSLPRPLASLAKGIGGRSRTADSGPGIPEVAVTTDSNPPQNIDSIPPENSMVHSDPQRGGRAEPASWSHPSSIPAAGPNGSANDAGVMQAALRASVRIRVEDATGNSLGSGTIIDSHGQESLVVTCGHLFRESAGQGRITVELFIDRQPRSVAGTLISCDLERDIALVAITPGVQVTFARVAPPGIDVQRGHAVFSIGCDQGANPSIRPSSITGIDRYVGSPNFEVAGMPIDGRSGGGLFASNGYLIGVCNAADPKDREGIFASLPIIHWELDKIGQRHIYESSNTQLADSGSRGESPANSQQELASARSMPREMPGLGAAISELDAAPRTAIPSGPAFNSAAGSATGPDSRFARGTSATRRDEEMEVICIVRSRSNPQSNDQLLVVDRPSREFLDRLAAESQHGPAAEVARSSSPPRSRSNLYDRTNPNSAPIEAAPVLRAQSNDR